MNSALYAAKCKINVMIVNRKIGKATKCVFFFLPIRNPVLFLKSSLFLCYRSSKNVLSSPATERWSPSNFSCIYLFILLKFPSVSLACKIKPKHFLSLNIADGLSLVKMMLNLSSNRWSEMAGGKMPFQTSKSALHNHSPCSVDGKYKAFLSEKMFLVNF